MEFILIVGPCRPYLLCNKGVCAAPIDDFDVVPMDQLLDDFDKAVNEDAP